MQMTGGMTLTVGMAFQIEPPTPPTDPYWSNVVVLLNTSSTNNLDNLNFLDISNNNLKITEYGNTTQGSYSPFTTRAKGYSIANNGGSAFFNGVDMSAIVAPSGTMAFGIGDFTTEAWVRVPAAPGGGAIYDKMVIGSWNWSNTTPLLFFIDNSNNYPAIWNGINQYTSTTGVTPNTWTHVAWVRKNGNLSFYINGTSVSITGGPGGGVAMSTNYSSSNVLFLGRSSNSDDRWFSSQMSSLRISNSAMYTSNFTPSTVPLSKTANTCLLINFNNMGMYDVSNTTWTFTSSEAVTDTNITKFGPSSAKFSGSGSYLNTGFSCNLGTNDFTIETWVYPTTSNTTQGITGFCDATPTNANTSFRMNMSSTNKLVSIVCSGSTAYTCTSSANISANTWTHIAFVRSGGSLTQYINGVADGTANIGAASVNTASGQTFAIGREGSKVNDDLMGHIEQYRLTNGVARYTSNFTLPTSAFPIY